MPFTTLTLFKFQKPPLSLKQFMLRSEVLKLYRGFMRLGRSIEPPAPTSSSATPHGSSCSSNISESSSHAHPEKVSRTLHPVQLEWIHWVRSEFRLREGTNDEESVKMMLAHGRRQLQELERTISLANNRNLKTTSTSAANSGSSCSHTKVKEKNT